MNKSISDTAMKLGGAGAAEYGLFVNGSPQVQMTQLGAAANNTATHNQNLLHMNNPANGWKGGKSMKKRGMKPQKIVAGTTLLEAAVPAVLLVGNQTFRRRANLYNTPKRKATAYRHIGSRYRGRRNNRSRKMRK